MERGHASAARTVLRLQAELPGTLSALSTSIRNDRVSRLRDSRGGRPEVPSGASWATAERLAPRVLPLERDEAHAQERALRGELPRLGRQAMVPPALPARG